MITVVNLRHASKEARRTISGDVEWTATQFRSFMHATEDLCGLADQAADKMEELEKERDTGYEFLRRWQQWATVVMRKLGEVPYDAFPDDTKTREVVLTKLEEERALRALVKMMVPIISQDEEPSFHKRGSLLKEAKRLGCT